jgi:C-terminal processing protease CtpA/Prc
VQRRSPIRIVWFGLAAVLLVATVFLAALVQQRNALRDVRAENLRLREDLKEIEALRAETKELRRFRDQQTEIDALRNDNKDLLRLRNEVRELREGAAEVDVLRMANSRLLQLLDGKGNLSSNEMASLTAIRKQGSILGIQIVPATIAGQPTAAQRYIGAMVGSILGDSPAAQSDLKVNDIIIRIDGRPVDSASQLQVELLTRKPGETVVLDVMRNDAVVRVPVKTRSWPQ